MAVDPKSLSDPEKLRVLADNACNAGREDLATACRLRIAELAGGAYEDVLDREFWQAVSAAEEFKAAERGRKTPLARTRQKYHRDGAKKTIEDVAVKPGLTDGFRILQENDRLDLSFEAIILRIKDRFETEVVDIVRKKMIGAGVDEAIVDGWSHG